MTQLNSCAVYTAIVTPLDVAGAPDLGGFEALLQRQEKAGNGVIVLGSTGESLAMNLETRRAVVTTAMKLQLTVPVMVGVAGFQLEDCQEWIRWCSNAGAEGFLLVTPIYAKPGRVGQEQWFTSLMDASDKPCMLYNVPSRAGVSLHSEALKTVSAHRNFWAVKESSGSVEDFIEYSAAAPNARMYCGDDGLMPYFATAGAKGLVSVAANVWPEATRRYAELSMQGKHAGLIPLWHEAAESLFTASNPIPVKALLHAKGWIARPNTLAPLATQDLGPKNLERLQAADRAITEWSH
jgi:4-hydroxy-tetrahydrodipicolinate synthase